MIAFGIVFLSIVVVAIAATIRNLIDDGYGRAPTAEIRREPEQSHWR